MKHLDDQGLVDAVEERLDAVDLSHLDSCGRCQAQVTELRDVLMRVAGVEEPAPSPLFWEHLRSRISDAVALPPGPAPARAGAGFRWLTAASFGVTIALVLVAVVIRPDDVERVPPREASTVTMPLQAETDDIDADEAWALVRSLADDLEYEDARAAGVAPASGALDRAALELSPAEQSALIRLLEEEMKRTDS